MAEFSLKPTYQSAQKTEANVKTRREKEGRCAECGLRTHKVTRSILGRKKEPLTIRAPGGEMIAFEGRCLVCHPFPTSRPSSSFSPSDTSGGRVAASSSIPASPSMKSSATSSSVPKMRPPVAPAAIAAPASPPKSGTSASYRPDPPPQPAVVHSSPPASASASAISGTTPPQLDLRLAPPEIASALRRLSTAATGDDVARACTDLGKPAFDDDNRAASLRAARASRAGIPAIVAAMKKHAEVAAVQEKACGTLYYLSFSSSNVPLMRSGGVQQLLEDAKKRFPSQCDPYASLVLEKL